jgi:hypothetical protein
MVSLVPKRLNFIQQAVILHPVGYCIIYKKVLYQHASHQSFKRCLAKKEIEIMIEAMHTEEVEGHYALQNTIRKIQSAGYWWPTMY